MTMRLLVEARSVSSQIASSVPWPNEVICNTEKKQLINFHENSIAYINVTRSIVHKT